MSALKYWLWLSSIPGMRPQTFSRLFEHFDSAEEIFFADGTAYLETGAFSENEIRSLCDKSLGEAMRISDRCAELGVTVLTMQDAKYPKRLMNISDPPLVLYIKGELPAMDDEAAIAIAGTRKATPYGIKMGRRLGYEITKGGGLIVSGLAEGIDSAGAEGALRAGGKCVGVLGSAINLVYPKSNLRLFDDVGSVGALVSEYAPDMGISPSNFPLRNRIISGLSAGVIIIEAPAKSGALITAARALEQGRELFVVPGNADSYNSKGSNELLRDGAAAVSSGWDVLGELENLFPHRIKRLSGDDTRIPQEEETWGSDTGKNGFSEEKSEKEFIKLRVPSTKKAVDNKKTRAYIDWEEVLKGLDETKLIIISAISEPKTHVDDIIERTDLPPKTVLSELTLMELDGLIIQERGKRFSLNITLQ